MLTLESSILKQTEVKSTTLPDWLELPRDVTTNILHRLGAVEILKTARNVCPLWCNICNDPLMWRTIDMSNLRTSPYDLVKMCRYAVEQSYGNLEDIHIEHFCTDDLLKYIADSTSHLRRIGLVYYRRISDKGLCEAMKKLPLLEELDISFTDICMDSLEVIGQCCSLLKSLELSNLFCHDTCDDEAFVIANTMSGLRRLNIFGNMLSNDGLLAILDGCPFLESLDLRECFNLDLSGSLGERCLEQIKNLWLPNQDDYLMLFSSWTVSVDSYDHSY